MSAAAEECFQKKANAWLLLFSSHSDHSEQESSFVSQRFDRIEVRGAIGWVKTEADPNC
jgi:hypothetical protein